VGNSENQLTPCERLVGLDDPIGWAAALEGIPHGFGHTWDCCNAIHQSRPYPTYLYTWQHGHARVVCPIAERRFQGHVDIVTPFGFSGFAATESNGAFADHWHSFVRRKGYVCGYLALHPTLDRPELHGVSVVANILYILDLRLGVDELLRRVSQKRRRAIKGWRESGCTFVTDRERLAEFIIQNHEPFMRRVRASAASVMSPATLRLLCASTNVNVIGVEVRGAIVAIHASGRTPWDSESLVFLALPEGREYMTALYWEAVERHAAEGIPTLNLGGGVQRDDSIAFAKKLYGAQPYEFRSLREVYNMDEYGRLCDRADVGRGGQADYFPAYRTARPLTADDGQPSS
jgi:hypothetical protein